MPAQYQNDDRLATLDRGLLQIRLEPAPGAAWKTDDRKDSVRKSSGRIRRDILLDGQWQQKKSGWLQAVKPADTSGKAPVGLTSKKKKKPTQQQCEFNEAVSSFKTCDGTEPLLLVKTVENRDRCFIILRSMIYLFYLGCLHARVTCY